jgi:hypothetical protein
MVNGAILNLFMFSPSANFSFSGKARVGALPLFCGSDALMGLKISLTLGDFGGFSPSANVGLEVKLGVWALWLGGGRAG